MRQTIVFVVALASGACLQEPEAQPPRVAVQALQAKLSRSTAGIRVETRADGIRKVDLGGRFSHATLLEHRGSDARKRICVESPDALSDRF